MTQHRIRQIRYRLTRQGPICEVYFFDKSPKRTYRNVSEWTRKRLSAICPEYDYTNPFERFQNSISMPGFTIVRVRS